MSYQTLDLFDLIDESEQSKPAPPVNQPTNTSALIAAYNTEKNRQHQDGDVYILDSGSCFHHLAE